MAGDGFVSGRVAKRVVGAVVKHLPQCEWRRVVDECSKGSVRCALAGGERCATWYVGEKVS